jgi:uncharacterized protein
MIIGLDLDDTLVDFREALHAHYNKRYGTNYKREHFMDNLAQMWNCSDEESVNRVFDFYHSLEHWEALPVAGAVDGIKKISQSHTLFIITSKPDELKEKTNEWLNKHFPDMFDRVCFTNQYHGNDPKRTKREICLELGVEIFVDDMLGHADDVACSGIPVLLLDAPWNHAVVKSPITRVYSWEEIVAHILSLQNTD